MGQETNYDIIGVSFGGLKATSETDIYLCGGGLFAGRLLDNGLIDVLKLNPIILGNGIQLFGNSSSKTTLEPKESEIFEDGLQILTYHLKH